MPPSSAESTPFLAGQAIAIRGIHDYPAHGRRVGFAVAGIVITDTDDVQVVCSPTGSELITSAGIGKGPNGRLVLHAEWSGKYRHLTWTGPTVVRVHRRGDPWSVWRWHDGSGRRSDR